MVEAESPMVGLLGVIRQLLIGYNLAA